MNRFIVLWKEEPGKWNTLDHPTEGWVASGETPGEAMTSAQAYIDIGAEYSGDLYVFKCVGVAKEKRTVEFGTLRPYYDE